MKLITSNSGHTLSVRKGVEYARQSWEFVLGSSRHVVTGIERYETIYTRDEAARLHRNLGIMLKATAPPTRKGTK